MIGTNDTRAVTVAGPATYNGRMKRLLLPASALVLVLTACGAGAKPAPRVAEVGAHVPSVHVLAARRERSAMREAKRLLREFAPPPGAHAIHVRPGEFAGAHVLHRSGSTLAAESAAVHAFWSVRKPLGAVAAFVRAHPLPGFGGRGAEYGTNVPHFLRWGRSSPTGSPTRYLTVTAVALPHHTVIRADVQVEWTYPRAPSEKAPSGTSTIVLHGYMLTKRWTDPAKVARIVRWFNALPVSPPRVHIACLLALAARVTLSFRNARGSWLAKASVPRTSADVCQPIGFSIGGHAQKPLVDAYAGRSFVERLMVKLLVTHR
jgi:hypothetical protein